MTTIQRSWCRGRRRDGSMGSSVPMAPDEVVRLRGSLPLRHTLAEHAADRLWRSCRRSRSSTRSARCPATRPCRWCAPGLSAIYLSGWQVAADANTAGAMYPDQSLYPANSGPELVRKINRTLQRADQIETMEGKRSVETWFAPIVADAEAGFGGPLNVFEIMKAYIEAGAGGVHFEDQLASEKKCGHMGGKVLIPTAAHIRNLVAARLAADVMGVSTLVIARTDAEAAKLITSDIDERDQEFIIPAERTAEGFYWVKNGLEPCIARAKAYAPYADLIWCETSKPDLEQAKRFAEGVHARLPGQDARLQLFAELQLEEASRRRDDRQVPARARRHGLSLPVHHARRVPSVEPRHVRARPRLPRAADGGLFGAAGGGVRVGGERLHGDAPSARGRHLLFRRRLDGDLRRRRLDDRDGRFDRDRAVRPEPRPRAEARREQRGIAGEPRRRRHDQDQGQGTRRGADDDDVRRRRPRRSAPSATTCTG